VPDEQALPPALSGFVRDRYSAYGTTRDVYRVGEGPAVVVIAEIPGITPEVASFGRRVSAAGFTAVLPHLFGVPGDEATMANAISVMAKACISKEFVAFARGRTSPVTGWLRALARDEHARLGGPGVGVVGMCFTGGFALAMMVEPVVLAPVLSQPSLPFPVSKAHRRDLGLSPGDLERAKRRCEAEDLCVLGLRFSNDRMSPPERFARLREELGDHFVGVEIDSSPGNPEGYAQTAHSVLTNDLKDEEGSATLAALDQVLDLFRSKLLAQA
jgi:dienelactone hydrolase